MSEDPRIRAEIARAARLLLRHPLLGERAADSEGFALVRRHREALEPWFRDQLGYRLLVRRQSARLIKRPLENALPRPLANRSGTPFDARRYSLFCLVAAALERTETQVVLSDLAESVKTFSVAEVGVEVLDLELLAERRAFVDAVQALVDLDVLRLTDGDEAAFVRGAGDALYDVSRPLLSQLLVSAVPPSLAAGPDELGAEIYPPTDEGRHLRRRHRILRRLVEEPALYLEDLDEEERAYFQSQRSYLVRQVREMLDLPVEVRSEGLALIDDQGRMSDRRFPAAGIVAHAALVLADHLAPRGDSAPVALNALHPVIEELLARYGKRNKSYGEDPEGAARLLGDALERLVELRLVDRRHEGVRPLPAIARYRSETVWERT